MRFVGVIRVTAPIAGDGLFFFSLSSLFSILAHRVREAHLIADISELQSQLDAEIAEGSLFLALVLLRMR